MKRAVTESKDEAVGSDCPQNKIPCTLTYILKKQNKTILCNLEPTNTQLYTANHPGC